MINREGAWRGPMRKSSRSQSGGGNCTILCLSDEGVVLGDSKLPPGQDELVVSTEAHAGFLAGLRSGAFDAR